MSLIIGAEAKVDSDPCVAAWDGKLFVGTEDGSIKIFDANLSAGASWQAHGVQLFALAAGNGKIYSSSNDGGIRGWVDDGTKIVELPNTGGDVGAIKVYGEEVYIGDEGGNVVIFQNNEVKAKYNLLEEVKDLGLRPPYLFTVRDLDLTVTEIKPDDSKTRCVTRHTMEGRAPMGLTGAYLLVMARDGFTLRLHSASLENTFKKLFEIKISDMIVTSISVKDSYVWTGGWDGVVRRLHITDDKLVSVGEINVGSCVNAVVAASADIAYAVAAGGKVVKITV